VSEQGGAPAGAEGAQAEAQGAEHTQPADYQQDPNGKYLQAANVPAELAPLVMEALKHKDADVTRGFQEHKQFREQWEPFSKIQGLGDMSPEDVGQLVEWSQAMNDPQAFQAWYEGVGQQLGLSSDLDEDGWVRMGEERGWFEGGQEGEQGQNGNGLGQLPPEVVQELEQSRQFREQMNQWMGKQEHERNSSAHMQQLEGRFSELVEKHGVDPKDQEFREDVVDLAYAMVTNAIENEQQPPEDPIGMAFDRVMRRAGKAQGDLIENKLNQPAGALNGGAADTRPVAASWHGNGPAPADIARERFRQQ
jgi:hypothetical protein